jgi:hypothetical protein
MKHGPKIVTGVLSAALIGGYVYLVDQGNGPDHHRIRTQNSGNSGQEVPLPRSYGTFRDSLTIHVDCGVVPDRGYYVVTVDGKQVAYINGTHNYTYREPGQHQWASWGSCTIE